ncbi:MAG: hypothetical protein H0X16_11275 [Chloroflexi bacterium]|nr:hypothetical protein [Chloroflexota bacterium]
MKAASATLERREAPEGARIAAVRAMGRDIRRRPTLIDRLIALLADGSESAKLRLEALDVLQGATFLVQTFAAKRPQYLEALRSIMDDPDRDLRRRVIGALAREKDEYVHRRLLEGLEKPSKALVPPAKAIQFLGYDVHADYFPLLRRIVEQPPTASAQREAIRVLAADPKSRPLLTKILGDKDQPSGVRYMSALALQSLAPTQFEGIARKIALDNREDHRLRAASLTALAQYTEPQATASQRAFTRRVEKLGERASSPDVKRATKAYMARVRG